MTAQRSGDANVLADILAMSSSQEKVDRLNELDPAGRDRLLVLALILLDDVAARAIERLRRLSDADLVDELWRQPAAAE